MFGVQYPPTVAMAVPHCHAMAACDPAVASWFQHVDTDRSGHITAQELRAALSQGGLNFSLLTCARMIRLHDRDGSGTIDLGEFQQVHKFITNCQASFYQFDTDRSGSLNTYEVQQALMHAGFRLDAPAFNSLFQAWDPDRSCTLGMDEFMAMCVFVQGLTKVFSAFDTQRTGRVTLDFNQMMYAATQC